MKILLPLLVVIPGIIAFRLYPGLAEKDQAFPTLVRELLPIGLSGIVMAALASGMLSHISSVLNSCSTVFTMDLYQPLLGRNRSDAHIVAVGRWSAFLILLTATVLAAWFTRRKMGVFDAIQNVGAWVAAPIASLFLTGVLWKGATAAAATFVLWFGFPFTAFVEHVLFKQVAVLLPFDNWLNRTFVVWLTCMALMVVVSLFTRAPEPARLAGIIWSPKMAPLPEGERARYGGWRSLFLWWAIFAGVVVALYAYLFYFQFFGPAKGL
jgi:SSS family solute:Na+ symporter